MLLSRPGLAATDDIVATVHPDGSWLATLPLAAGENVASVRATDPLGRVTLARLTLHHQPEPATRLTRSIASSYIAFSAQQAYGSCADDPPYDVFSGAAAPGATISVISPYGSASTAAGTDGQWAARVEFPQAPVRAPFSVTASDGAHSKTLSFVRER